MKKHYIIIVFLLFGGSYGFGQTKIQIDIKDKETKHQLGINKFYFVHHTFADAFFMTNLYKELSNDEMSSILNAIYNGVTQNDKAVITIRQENSILAKLVFSVMTKTKDGDLFIMSTNFNNSTRKFEKEVEDNNALTRWYFIRGEKLVYRKDAYSKTEEKNKKKGEAYGLIDFYLFDDNIENDSKVKPLIDKLLNSEKIIDKLYAKLYLGEYWLKNGDIEKAEKSVDDLKEFFATEKEIPKGYSLILNMATSELEMFKKLK